MLTQRMVAEKPRCSMRHIEETFHWLRPTIYIIYLLLIGIVGFVEFPGVASNESRSIIGEQ